MTSKLLPCPFCGGRVKSAARKGEGFVIICHCGANYSPVCATAEDCDRAWNRRAVIAPLSPDHSGGVDDKGDTRAE